MYKKLSANYKRRQNCNFEDEPPQKKLISEGDNLIKQFAKKQRETQINLKEQLSARNNFYKSTEVVPVTNYTSGSKTLKEFNFILQHSDHVEELNSYNLSKEEIELFLDFRKGSEFVKKKHRNMNEAVLKSQIEEIFDTIEQSSCEPKKERKCDKLTTEMNLAAKPNSMETRLLKFVLENQQSKQTLPSPMDQIVDINKTITDNLANIDVKKIRKKARSLAKQIEELETPLLKEPTPQEQPTLSLSNNSKWDLKSNLPARSTERKTFTCKQQNFYTVQDGEIIKINTTKSKLSVEEIKKLPKFENYKRGSPSNILYLKNLPTSTHQEELKSVLDDFSKLLVSVKIMGGRMRGQAFLEFENELVATQVLDQCNGTFIKNRPVIIQFGHSKSS